MKGQSEKLCPFFNMLVQEYVCKTSLALMAGSPERPLSLRLRSLNSHFARCARESLSAATLMDLHTYFAHRIFFFDREEVQREHGRYACETVAGLST